MTFDAGRVRHDSVLMHYSRMSNGSAAPSNSRLSATGDTGLAWTPDSAASPSFGSNSNEVSYANAPGASTLASRADHVHRGVTSLAHASNTYTGPVTLETEGSLYIVRPSANTFRLGSTGTAGGGSGTLTTVKDEGSTLSSSVASLDFVGAGVTATGTTAVTVTIPGGGNYPPLDQYTIDGTYGDHFTAASLSGSWTRRNYTSGAETYQAGYNGTFLRISKAGRTNGDGYFRTAPAGDWTFAMAFIPRLYNTNSVAWGVAVMDTNGTGVATCVYNAPAAPLLIAMTTYSSYGGTYVQVGSTSASPNLAVWDSNTVRDRKLWVKLRKSGTSYYTAVSIDGEVWSPESGAQTWSGTVDRVGMMDAPLGSITSGQGYGSYVDVDWFNKIG